jgi:branched-chain amino acid transport system ATP-binding protein
MSLLLDVKGLTKRYGGLTANAEITFDVSRGEILGIIGPNGAGK